jgi:hypothetical protein
MILVSPPGGSKPEEVRRLDVAVDETRASHLVQRVDALHQPLGIRPPLQPRAVGATPLAVQPTGGSFLHHDRVWTEAAARLSGVVTAGGGSGGAGGGEGWWGRGYLEVVKEGGGEWLAA